MRDKNSPIVTLIEKFLSSENCKCMEIDLNGIHDIQNSN